MANIQQVKNEALSIIDSAMTILNKFPDLDQTDVSLSFGSSLNPLPFLMDLFKRTKGYNAVLNIVAKFISYELPIIEAGVKGVLIAKLKDIISCSVNPFFTKEILENGIVFNVEEIDIADVLRNSPFDTKVGKNFYFDVDGEEDFTYNELTGLYTPYNKPLMTDDLIKCNDLNALIWYMINISSKRHVWKPKKYRKGAEFRPDYPHSENDSASAHMQEMYTIPLQELEEAFQGGEITQETYDKKVEELEKKWQKYQEKFNKLKKEDGIITLEFHKSPQSVKSAYGDDYKLQTPYGNCLHVFIGDAREKEDAEIIRTLRDSIENVQKQDKDIKLFNKQLDKLDDKIQTIKDNKKQLREQLNNGELTGKDYKKEIKKANRKIKNAEKTAKSLENLRQRAYETKQRFQYTLGEIKNNLEETADVYFPFINSGKIRNYYYGKTLIQFNIDYITSLQLFDEKSLAARLLDCLTGSLIIDFNLTYSQQLIKNEVKKMVQMVTETDDLVVSDCFFTFSNKDYDEMSRKAELRKAGLLTINGDETSAVKIDAEKIFSSLNEINKDTSKEKMVSIMEGTLKDISKELSSVDYLHKDNVNAGVQVNFIENILNSLAEALVMTVLSPKVYLLLLINLKIIGRETNFNLIGFLEQYKQLIVEIIRSIRDMLLEFLTREIMMIVSNLVKEVTLKLSLEQVFYWQRLLKRLIDCFKFQRDFKIDFDIDDVDYADILSTNEEPANKEC